jgi:hypothetical protein
LQFFGHARGLRALGHAGANAVADPYIHEPSAVDILARKMRTPRTTLP